MPAQYGNQLNKLIDELVAMMLRCMLLDWSNEQIENDIASTFSDLPPDENARLTNQLRSLLGTAKAQHVRDCASSPARARCEVRSCLT